VEIGWDGINLRFVPLGKKSANVVSPQPLRLSSPMSASVKNRITAEGVTYIIKATRKLTVEK